MEKIPTTELQMMLAHIRTNNNMPLTQDTRDKFTSIILELILARHTQEDLIELLKSADDKIEKLEWKLMFANKDKISAELIKKRKERESNEE